MAASHQCEQEQLAAGYAVLAACWRQPTAELVQTANAGELPFTKDFEDIRLEDLSKEHTRLFVGPSGPPCPPYESVYRDREGGEFGKVLGPTTRAVVKWYETHDLGLDPEWPDMPDHIGTELEFLSYLTAEGEEEAAEQFLQEHPQMWFGEFLTAVREESREPFYRALAEATAVATGVSLEREPDKPTR